MRAALLMLGATAHAQICPAPADVATVSNDRGVTVTAANTGNIQGQVSTNPFPWIPAENVMLHPMSNVGDTLNCGAWYTLGPDRMVAAGKQVLVDCNSPVCDVYAFLYHEPPRSSDTNGGLPLTLPDATPEWSRGSCAPQFCKDSYCCNMAAYRLQIEAGGTATIPIGTTPAMYLMLAVAPGAKCSSTLRQQSQSACVASPSDGNALCRWEGDSCVDNWCPRRFGVPTPGGGSSGGGSSGGAPAPSCQAPLSVPSSSSQIFNTGIGTNGQILPNFQDDDPHWEVMEENTPGWVPAEYDLTNYWFSQNQWVQHPFGSAGSRPLAHPQFPRKMGGYPGTTFHWRQVFSVGNPTTASVTYQIGFDDVSKSATGNHLATCAHTVWVNGNPINQPHFVPNPPAGGQQPRYNTRCQGTLPVNTFQSGQNSIEFRIANIASYYGFRFEKLSATGGL